jgi:hypothetical protein
VIVIVVQIKKGKNMDNLVRMLKSDYNFYCEMIKEIEKIEKAQEKLGELLFDDFFGISKLNNLKDMLVKRMDKNIGDFYNIESCDLFSYLIYEAMNMKDGGSITTEKGKYFKIRNFDDLIYYLENN